MLYNIESVTIPANQKFFQIHLLSRAYTGSSFGKRSVLMTKNKQSSGITYQNKDVLSKILAENLKEKSLKVYGLDLPKITQVLPTNLPVVQANEINEDR